MSEPQAIVIGAGPAGLMAAEVLLQGGVGVTILDRMPSAGRKFLMAGRGGLNLTHSEPFEMFVGKYGAACRHLIPALSDFPPTGLRAWCEALGQPTFIGSSGRIFPVAMKASPLLRSWMARLVDQGAKFSFRETWLGWEDCGALVFENARGDRHLISSDAVVLALGGASWPRLGSDGLWSEHLRALGVGIVPFEPANGGFGVDWSDHFRDRFAGKPLKAVGLTFEGQSVAGEAMITKTGLQGGGVYALSHHLRESLRRGSATVLEIDLRPGMTAAEIALRLARARSGDTISNQLRKALKLGAMEVALMREGSGGKLPTATGELAAAIKAVPIRLTGVQSLERAISSAGGVTFDALDQDFMLAARPGTFLAGEMLDWEAPTGGYLLQACLATGRAAGLGALNYIRRGQDRRNGPA